MMDVLQHCIKLLTFCSVIEIYYTFFRGEESKETNFHVEEDQEANYHDLDSKSDGSGSTFARSAGSSSSKDLGSTSHPGELGSRV